MRDGLLKRFQELDHRTAVIDRDLQYTYDELAREIRRLGKSLESQQVHPHDVVVLNADFSYLSIATFLALFVNRNIVVPIVSLTEETRQAIVDSCLPQHIVRVEEDLVVEGMSGGPSRAHTEAYERLIERQAAGLVLLSSGSTGAPKAILHDLDVLVAEKLGQRTRTSSRAVNILMFLLFDHIGGINSLLGALRVGGTAIVPGQRTPDEVCGLIETHGVRLVPTSPTFLNLILIGDYHRKYDLSSLRLITYGTEPMPEELLKRVHSAFPRARLLQTFGTSETGISTTTSESSKSTYFRIDDPNVRYRIVDGELQLKSTTQFMGYLNYPNDVLTEDSWFRTGDLVEETAEGFIRIKGRSKEVINVGGEKVLPLELESILLGSPLIDDCLVYGRANAITGQSVCVDVKPTGAMSRATVRKHVLAFLAGKVEPFKIPSKVHVVDSITVSERFKKRRISP